MYLMYAIILIIIRGNKKSLFKQILLYFNKIVTAHFYIDVTTYSFKEGFNVIYYYYFIFKAYFEVLI